MKERYINAVASYFGRRRNEYKRILEEELKGVETVEEILSHGHPKTKAYEYGYRNNFKDYLNHPAIKTLNDIAYITINVYLMVAIIVIQYKLKLYNFNEKVVVQKIVGNSVVTSLMCHVMEIVCLLTIIYTIVSVILILRNDQERPKEWNEEALSNLPKEATYHLRNTEVILDFVALTIAVVFLLVYSNHHIVYNSPLKTLFEPFILLMAYDILYSYKERLNHKSCNRNRILVNTFSLICTVIFLFNGQYLPFIANTIQDTVALMLTAIIVAMNVYNIVTNTIAYFTLKK